MTEQEKRKELDELLDSLLASYSDVEPRPGIETRLLANLRAHSLSTDRNPRPIWRWFLAAAGAVAIAVSLLVIYISRPADLPQPPKIRAAGPPSLPAVPVLKHAPRHVGKQRVPQRNVPASIVVADVRRQVFPTPSPMSDQERLLLRYLAKTPGEEVAAQSHGDKPEETLEAPVPQSQQFTGTETQSSR